MNTSSQGTIITKAIEAKTFDQAVEVTALIEEDVGARYTRPVGDRWNNYGIMAGSGGSYEYKALEPVTNMQDAVLELLAADKFTERTAVPYQSPSEAAHDLLGSLNYQEQADKVVVEFEESDPPTRRNKRLTIVYRDRGCGIAPAAIPTTIFKLGSSHKTDTVWQQGAFGMGGASTYRNAQAVVLVTRTAPQNPIEERISVAVVIWEAHGKGQTAYYLTTTEWTEDGNSEAEPWSAPASVHPEFEPGTHLALISYGVEGFHRARSGDERSMDMVLNTRLYRPAIPVRFRNNITRGKNEYLRGLAQRLSDNPNPDRETDEEEMLYTHNGVTYKLPVRFHVFPPASEAGMRRRFVAKNHALVFTSNGQVHHHWAPAQFKLRTALNKLSERIFVTVETDRVPIELRTALFTPDRSQLLASEAAIQLEDQVADFLDHWHRLVDINSQLIREAISSTSGGRSALEVAKRISAALKVKGFSLAGLGGTAGTNGGGPGGLRKRKKVETYNDPTAFEGPDRMIVEDGKIRYVEYMLNACDDFLDSGRGALAFGCDHPDIDPVKHVSVGRLRDGYVRVQLQVPEGADQGAWSLTASLTGWLRASGGLGPDLSYTTKLEVVDELPTRQGKAGKGEGTKGANEGANVAVIWETDYGEDWTNAVPGSVDMIPASTLVEKRDEYAGLKSMGEEKVPTIILNETYAPYKAYVSARAKALTEGGVKDAGDRYATGVGLGLLMLSEETRKREKAKEAVDEKLELASKQAIARSVLLMMPAFDAVLKEAGLEE